MSTMMTEVLEEQNELAAKYSSHWAVAVNAVKYVQSKMTVGASNKLSDVFGNLFTQGVWTKSHVDGMREAVEQELSAKQKEQVKAGADTASVGKGGKIYWDLRIEIEARRAAQAGCGNCGEQTSMAFEYLKRNGVRPLDHMQIDGLMLNHAFVVIGRHHRSDYSVFSTWGPGALVCDAWKGDVFTVENFYRENHGTITLNKRLD